MPELNIVARSVHDLGLAAWFGGSAMGAIGLHGAAETVADERERAGVVTAGWNRWSPVQNAGVAAHLVTAALVTRANRGRLVGQRGVARVALAKGGLTAAAVAATAYAAWLGNRMDRPDDPPVTGATEPTAETPPEVARAQRRLGVVQWTVPALTGALVVLNAWMGEQQRPTAVAAGVARRFVPFA